jgi:hypothetical protein
MNHGSGVRHINFTKHGPSYNEEFTTSLLQTYRTKPESVGLEGSATSLGRGSDYEFQDVLSVFARLMVLKAMRP